MLELLKDLFTFAREHKKLAFLPLVFILLSFGVLLVFLETSVFAPFIYTLF